MLACGCTPAVGSATGFRCFLYCPSLSRGLWLGWFLWVLFSLLVLNLRDGVTPVGSRLVLLDRIEGLACFSFPLGCFLVFPLSYVSDHLLHQVCWSVPTCSHIPVVRPHPVAAGAFLLVLAAVDCLRFFLALSSVLPFLLLCFHVRLHNDCSRPWLVLGALPSFLPGKVRPSACGFSSRPATAGAFPGGPPYCSESSCLLASLLGSTLSGVRACLTSVPQFAYPSESLIFHPSLLLLAVLVRFCGGPCCRSLAMSWACLPPFLCVGLVCLSLLLA